MNKQLKKELQLFLIFPILGFISATLIAGISVDIYWRTWIGIFIAVNVLGLFIFIFAIVSSFTDEKPRKLQKTSILNLDNCEHNNLKNNDFHI